MSYDNGAMREVSESKINCTNGTSRLMLLIIEPWAEQYWLTPGMSVDVVAVGGVGKGAFEVEYVDEGMIVYAWEGSVVSVLIDGVEAEPDSQI